MPKKQKNNNDKNNKNNNTNNKIILNGGTAQNKRNSRKGASKFVTADEINKTYQNKVNKRKALMDGIIKGYEDSFEESKALYSRKKIKNSDVARQTAIDEIKKQEARFEEAISTAQFMKIDAEMNAGDHKNDKNFIKPDVYDKQIKEEVMNRMASLLGDYKMGFIPKNYLIDRFKQLKRIYDTPDLNLKAPEVFENSPAGKVEERRVIADRMWGEAMTPLPVPEEVIQYCPPGLTKAISQNKGINYEKAIGANINRVDEFEDIPDPIIKETVNTIKADPVVQPKPQPKPQPNPAVQPVVQPNPQPQPNVQPIPNPQPENQPIPISDNDFEELALMINIKYNKANLDIEGLLNEMKGKSPEVRYQRFVSLIDDYPHAWEFGDYTKDYKISAAENDKRFYEAANEILPVEIRNSGDEAEIRNYIIQNEGKMTDAKPGEASKQVLTVKAKARLVKRLEVINKKKLNQEFAVARNEGVEPFYDRPKFVVNGQKVDELTEEQKNGRILLDVHMPKGQTSGNGCWSCSMQMLLQGRGVKNITQEDIRAYRPNYGKQMREGRKFKESHVIDKAFNSDDMQNVMDMGDAAVNLAPDSMLRTLDILKISDAESAMFTKFTPQQKQEYMKNATELFKKTVRKVLTEEKSPISISDGTHYITIVGIDGDNMLIKSSSSAYYDHPAQRSISSFINKTVGGNHKCQMVWMTDIKLAKDNQHFWGVPSETLQLDENGKYKMPPVVQTIEANSMKAEQEYEGFRVRLYAGKEDTRDDRADRNILVDGVVKIEQAYMPKNINVERLKGMAKVRSNEEEEKLRTQTVELLGFDPTKERPIKQEKKKPGRDYEVERKFKLDDLQENEKGKHFDDDVMISKDKKGNDFVNNREERLRDKMFNPFTLASGKEKDGRIKETNQRINEALGINKAGFKADVDKNGKEYVWNKPGADLAYRLELAYSIAVPILQGLGNEKKLKEIQDRYNILKAKLNNPKNAITEEDNLSGFDGEGVVLPTGIKMTHYFKNQVERYDAALLLASISNSVSLADDLAQVKMTEYTKDTYDPTAFSRAVENMQILSDYTSGNLLRAAGKSELAKNAAEGLSKLPEAEKPEDLHENFNGANTKEEMKEFVGFSIGFEAEIVNEYKTAGKQFVGPVPDIKPVQPKAEVDDNKPKYDGITADDILNFDINGDDNKDKDNEKEPIIIEEKKDDNIKPEVDKKDDNIKPEVDKKDDNIKPEEEKKDDNIKPEEEKKDDNIKPEVDKKDDVIKPEEDKPKAQKKGARNIVALNEKSKKITVYKGLNTVGLNYDEFCTMMYKADFDLSTTNAVFNLYKDDMAAYLTPLYERVESGSGVDDEMKILVLRGIASMAGEVKGKTNNDSLSHINSSIFKMIRKWEKENQSKFEELTHKDYDFYTKGMTPGGESGKESFKDKENDKEIDNGKENPKDEIDDIGEFPFDPNYVEEKKGDAAKPEGEKKGDAAKPEGEKKGDAAKPEGEKKGDAAKPEGEKKDNDTKPTEENQDDEPVFEFNDDEVDYRTLIMIGDEKDVMSVEQLRKLDRETDINITARKNLAEEAKAQKLILNDQFKNPEDGKRIRQAYKNVAAGDGRPVGYHSLFVIWAMGHVGYSFQNAIRLLDNPGYESESLLTDFNKFCEDNQIFGKENNPEEYKKAVTNWAKVYKQATDTMKAYKLPNIDYMDRNALDNYHKELFMLNALAVNANQDQIDGIFNSSRCTTDSARNIAIEALGSEKEYMDMTMFWLNIQGLTSEYHTAYSVDKSNDLKDNKTLGNVKEILGKKKVYDYILRSKLNRAKGKSLAEAEQMFKTAGVVETFALRSMINYDDYHMEIPFDDIVDYAIGIDIKPFVSAVENKKKDYIDTPRKDKGNVFAASGKAFIKEFQHDTQIAEAFLNAPDDTEKRMAFLEETDADGRTYKSIITEQFKEFNDKETWPVLEETGYRISGLFVIDGKSPEEIWGHKYKDVQDPEMREWLLRSDIYKTCLMGTKDIQIRNFELDENYKPVEKGLITVLPNKTSVEKRINGLELYKEFIRQAQKRLASYKNVMLKHPEDSDEFGEVIKEIDALNKTLSGDVNDMMTLDDLKVAFQPLKKAAAAYSFVSEDPSNVNFILLNTIPKFFDEATLMLDDIFKEMDGPTYEKAKEQTELYSKFYKTHLTLNKKKEEDIAKEYETRRVSLDDKIYLDSVKRKLNEEKDLTREEVAVLNRYVPVMATAIELDKQFSKDIYKVVPLDGPNRARYLEAYNGSALAATRGTTMSSVYMLWLMGEKGYDFHSALEITHRPAEKQPIEEFVQFCKDNPINQENAKGHTPDEFAKSAKNWAKIMKNSTEIIKNYQVPDIDYSNPKEVSKYYDEINAITGLTVNFIQEFGRMEEVILPGGRGADNKDYIERPCIEDFKKYIGNEAEYEKMRAFWKGIQSAYDHMTKSFSDISGKEDWAAGKAKSINKTLATYALFDVFAKNEFDRIKGKKLGEISPQEMLRQVNEKSVRINAMGDISSGKIAPDKDSVLAYMMGEDKQEFEFFLMNEHLQPRLDEIHEIKAGSGSAYVFIDRFNNQPNYTQLITAVQDDPASVKEFAAHHKDVINDILNDILTMDMYEMASQFGIDPLDLFVIDGRKPTEIWADKYADVLNPVDKAYIIKTEILKATLSGEHKIEFRTGIIDQNFNYKPYGTALAATTRAETKSIADNFDIYNSLIDDIKSKGMEYVSLLAGTQRDPNNNFRNDEVEGSDPYVKMCHDLASVVYLASQKNKSVFSTAELKEKMEDFQKSAELYFKRGKTSNQVRLDVAGTAAKEMVTYIKAVDKLFKEVDKNFTFNGTGTPISQGSMGEIKYQVDRLFAGQNRVQPMQRLTPEAITAKKAELLETQRALTAFENKFVSAAGKLPDTTKKMSTEEVAKLFVYKEFMDRLTRPGVTVEEINATTDIITSDVVKDNIKEFTNNKIFKLMASRHQEKTPEKWNELLDNVNNLASTYTAFSKNHKGNAAIDYIHKVVLDADTYKNPRDQYDRLGEVMAKQILSMPINKPLLQGIAARQFEYKDLEKACTDYFRKNEVLSPDSRKYLNDETLMTKLNDGSLKGEVLTKISEPLKKAIENHARQEAAEKKAAETAAKNAARNHGPRR